MIDDMITGIGRRHGSDSQPSTVQYSMYYSLQHRQGVNWHGFFAHNDGSARCFSFGDIFVAQKPNPTLRKKREGVHMNAGISSTLTPTSGLNHNGFAIKIACSVSILFSVTGARSVGLCFKPVGGRLCQPLSITWKSSILQYKKIPTTITTTTSDLSKYKQRIRTR